MHLFDIIHFFSKLYCVWVVLEEIEVGISYHCTLYVESTIAKEKDCVTFFCLSKIRTCTSKHLTFRSWLALGKHHISKPSLLLKHSFCQEQGLVELNNTHQNENLILFKIVSYSFHKHLNVKFDFYKYIKSVLDDHVWDCNQARVAVMHDKITAKLFACYVVYTARSVSHIAQYETFNLTELVDDISNQGRVH